MGEWLLPGNFATIATGRIGSQREFAAFGCGRSVAILSQSSVETRE